MSPLNFVMLSPSKKISPPLTISREAVEEGLAVLGAAVDEAVAALG